MLVRESDSASRTRAERHGATRSMDGPQRFPVEGSSGDSMRIRFRWATAIATTRPTNTDNQFRPED